MLLHRGVVQGVDVLAVAGPVDLDDAHELRAAVGRALAAQPRGVLLDLGDAGEVGTEALDVLCRLAEDGAAWPRPGLAMCCASAELSRSLRSPALHGDRQAALDHMDDRAEAPRARVELEPGPDAPAQGRAAVAGWLRDLGLDRLAPGLADDLSLVVSELVTNAVRYGVPPVVVEVAAGEHEITVAVADGSDEQPHPPAPASTTAEGGRGMLLVSLLSQETGVRPQSPGKTVWASLPLDGGPV